MQPTHLHEVLLHVGGEIAQDAQLRLQSPGYGAHREGEVLRAGGVVVHNPESADAEAMLSFLPFGLETPDPGTQKHTPRCTPAGYREAQSSTYFLLADRAMCVPSLKSTATRRLDS